MLLSDESRFDTIDATTASAIASTADYNVVVIVAADVVDDDDVDGGNNDSNWQQEPTLNGE